MRKSSYDSQSATALEEYVPDEPRVAAEPRVRSAPRPSLRMRKAETRVKEAPRRQGSRFDDFEDFGRTVEPEMPYDTPASGRAVAPKKARRSGMRLPEATWARWAVGVGAAIVVGGVAMGGVVTWRFFHHSPRFSIVSSGNVVVSGNHQVSADDVRAVFAEDIGRNIFYVPMAERQAALSAMPWVHHATVERLLPDRIGVEIVERVPTAFAQNKGSVDLVDSDGVVMTMPSATHAQYSFPVVTGVSEDLPQSTRMARMQVYQEFMSQVDAAAPKASRKISEMDLSDPEDVVASVQEDDTQYTVHFGDQDFRGRWQTFESHLADWRRQYPKLASVDLRNAPQVTLGMSKGSDFGSSADAPPAPEAAASQPAAPDAAAASQPDVSAVNSSSAPAVKPVSAVKSSATAKPAVAKAQPVVKKAATPSAVTKKPATPARATTAQPAAKLKPTASASQQPRTQPATTATPAPKMALHARVGAAQ